MSTHDLIVAFVVILVLLLAVNGYLAWRIRQMEGWFRAVINAGYKKESDER
jgi:hypothetical protein